GWRLCRLARRRRSGGEVGAEEGEGLASFRGASKASEPGIHNHDWGLWIPGLRPEKGAFRNDGRGGFAMTTTTDDPLVSTDWLAAHIDDPKVRMIDASFKLPGVMPLPIDDYLAA